MSNDEIRRDMTDRRILWITATKVGRMEEDIRDIKEKLQEVAPVVQENKIFIQNHLSSHKKQIALATVVISGVVALAQVLLRFL